MGYDRNSCNTGLSLSLGAHKKLEKNHLLYDQPEKKKSSSVNFIDESLPSLTLGLSSVATSSTYKVDDPSKEVQATEGCASRLNRQNSSISGASSFSNSSTVKRERDVHTNNNIGEEVLDDPDDDDEGTGGTANGTRKKLRLTKEQSLVLEETFKQHSTLNPKQKQALAEQLNLRPRQVEVWFQNRRARTKLKQNEVDCEMLKKCCETLTDDNRRLQKEIQELKALKLSSPFYMQIPAATLTMCPSCERIAGAAGTGENSSKSPFSSLGSNPHLFSPFTHPSAAC